MWIRAYDSDPTEEEKTTALDEKPRGRRNGQPSGRATTLYLSGSWPIYQQLCRQKLNQSGSAWLSELMRQNLSKLQGNQGIPDKQNVAELESQVSNLIVRGKKVKALLLRVGVYHYLEDLATDWNLNFDDFGNLDQVTQLFLNYFPQLQSEGR